MGLKPLGIDHVVIRTKDHPAMMAFYQDVIGCTLERTQEAIGLYQRGAALKAHCQNRLEAARLRVEQIVVGQGGQAERADPADFQ